MSDDPARTRTDGGPPVCITRSPWHASTIVVVLTVAGALACGARQTPLPPGTPSVAAIALEPVAGTKITAPKSTITSGLALERARRRGEPFDRYLLAMDTDRVKGWYVRHGWFRVQVHAEPVPVGKDAMRVVFHIDEGNRSKLTRVEIGGLPDDPDVDRDAVRAVIKLHDGDWFDYDAFDLAKPELEGVLGRWGYAKAHLDASVAADQVRDEAIIRLSYTAGPKCRFGRITITGTSDELAQAARDRLAAHEGDTFSTIALADSRAALYDMNRFSMARIEPDTSGPGDVVPVAIALTESSRHELRLGGGVGMSPTSYEVRTRAGYTVTGYPGPLESVRFALTPALVRMRDTGAWEPRVDALASIDRIDLGTPFLTGTAEVGVQWLTVEAYTTYGPHVQLGLKYPIWGRYLQASVNWHLEELGFRHVSPAITPQLAQELGLDHSGFGGYRLGYYEETLIADARDNQLEPRLGAYGELRAHEGTVAAGGQFTYVRLVPELRGYVPLGPIVFASRARAGAILGDLPATERFFAGGANSERGFGERRLSPFADTVLDNVLVHVPYGGGAMLELSEEARFPIGTLLGMGIGGVAFIDGGDDTERLADLNVAHLHWAAGPGLRVHTIIGAVRLDVAWRLDRYGPGEPDPGSRLAFHISIGEAF